MDAERWQQAKKIFEAAVDLPPEERGAYLREACCEDLELRREVETLLASDDSQHSLLDAPAAHHFDLMVEGDMIGRRIGAFRVVRKIASGGMGSVYYAERADGQFDQCVAIKVIRHGVTSEDAVKRFAFERQILAGLQHPNIARLVDGGITESGQPYFAMEFVDGRPLTEYCDTLRLTVDERVELFEVVCDAVQFAHQNLIVHRDMKPGNILVDADGVVKLVDFGIAKLLDDAEATTGKAGLTHTRGQVMTPAYASPEQRAGRQVSTATDVYSLGVVLYELLTGERPFEFEGMSPGEIEELMATTPPERPSARVSDPDSHGTPAESTTTVFQHRSASPQQLRHTLRGDLDNICLMALRAESERRYASAGQLADDLRRYRNREPVVARASTVAYRFQRFVSRHRAVASATAAFVLLVAVLTTFYVTRLATERDRAQIEAEKAKQVAGFLGGLFEAADPNNSKGDSLTALDLLEAGRRQIDSGLADEPEVKASMTTVLADTYHQLGRLEDAQELYEFAVATAPLGTEEYALAVQQLGVNQYDLGNYDSSAACAERSLHMHIQLYGEKDVRVAEDLAGLAASVRHMGNLDSAEVLYRESLRLRRELLGNEHVDVAHSLNHLGRTLWSQGRYAEAEPLLREGLAIRLRLLGDDNYEVIASRGALARLLSDTGRFKEAADLYRKCVRSMRKLVGDKHHYVGALLASVGNAELQAGNFTAAESLFTQGQQISEATLPPGHVKLSNPMYGLAQVYMRTGRATKAEPLARKALKLREDNLSDGNFAIAEVQSLLGACLGQLGQVHEADSLLRVALVTQTEALGANHLATQETKRRLAALHATASAAFP